MEKFGRIIEDEEPEFTRFGRIIEDDFSESINNVELKSIEEPEFTRFGRIIEDEKPEFTKFGRTIEEDYESADPSTGDIFKGVGTEVLAGGLSSVVGGLVGGAAGSLFGGAGAIPGALIGSSLFGGIGSYFGSKMAQDIEGQEEFSRGRATGAAAVGAIPFGGVGAKAITGATKITGKMIASAAGREAAKGGVLGGTEATIATQIDEGRMPTKEEYAAYVGGGTLFGGALGAASPKIGKSMDKFFGKTGEDIDRAIATGEIEYKDIENWTLATSRDTPDPTPAPTPAPTENVVTPDINPNYKQGGGQRRIVGYKVNAKDGRELYIESRAAFREVPKGDTWLVSMDDDGLETFPTKKDALDWIDETNEIKAPEPTPAPKPFQGSMPGEAKKLILKNMDETTQRVRAKAAIDALTERRPFSKIKDQFFSIVAPSKVIGKEARNEALNLRKRIASTNELGSRVGKRVNQAIAKDASVEQKVNDYLAGGELDASLGSLQGDLITYRDKLYNLQSDLIKQLTAEDMAAMNPQKLEEVTQKILTLREQGRLAGTRSERSKIAKELVKLDKAKKGYEATPKLIKKIRESRDLGNFTRREFRAYTDRKFVNDPALRRNALDEITKAYQKSARFADTDKGRAAAAEAAEKHVEKLESRFASVTGETGGMIKGQPLEAPLKKKNEKIGPAELEWLGEITDTGERISGTLSGVGKLVARKQTDANLLEILTKQGLTSPAKNSPAGNVTLGLRAGEVKGVTVSPEVNAAVNSIYLSGGQELSSNKLVAAVQDLYSTAVGLSKATKVLLNPPAYAVQAYGNAFTLAGMGVNPFQNLRKAGRLAFAEYGGLENLLSPANKKERIAFLKEVNDMTKYGIKGANIVESDIRDAFERGIFSDLTEKPVGFFGKLYSVPDTMGRYIGWKAQQKVLKKTFPGLGEEEYKRLGAEMINDTYQNYDRLSELVKKASRAGIMPQFASFTAEFVRNQYNQAKTIKQMLTGTFGKDLGIDLNRLGYSDAQKAASLKAMRVEGAKRAAALGTLYAGTAATIDAINADGGVTDGNEKSIKESFASWDQGKSLAIRMSEDGKSGTYANVSYIAPIALGIAAYDAAMSDKPLEGLRDMVVQEFMGEGTFVNRSMMQAINNRNERGQKITYSENDVEKAKELLGYFVSEAFTPGISREYNKLSEALKGNGDLSVMDVLKRQLGYRMNTFNLAENNKFYMMDHKANADGNAKAYNKAKDANNLNPEQLEEVYQKANAGRRESMDMIARRNQNLINTNHTEQERIQVMKDAGIGTKDILNVLRGTYRDLPRTKLSSITDQYELIEGDEKEKRSKIMEILKEDRVTGKALLDKWNRERAADRKNLSPQENLLMRLDVRERVEEIMSHPNPDGYLKQLRRKGIATKKVVELVRMRQRQ